jgi:hypothetical protein
MDFFLLILGTQIELIYFSDVKSFPSGQKWKGKSLAIEGRSKTSVEFLELVKDEIAN